MSSTKNVEKQDDRPAFWFADAFSTSSLNGMCRNLTGSEKTTSSSKCVFFGPIELKQKTRWLPQPLIGWDVFVYSETTDYNLPKHVFRADEKKMAAKLLIYRDIFFSGTAEQNLQKLDRKHNFTPFTKFVFFRPIGKNNMAAPASDCLRHFRLFLIYM